MLISTTIFATRPNKSSNSEHMRELFGDSFRRSMTRQPWHKKAAAGYTMYRSGNYCKHLLRGFFTKVVKRGVHEGRITLAW